MVSVCCRFHCGDNRISRACCKACIHFLARRTILLTTFVSQARQHTKEIHVNRLKILVKIPDYLYLKNGIVVYIVSIWSAFFSILCFKIFYQQTSSFSAYVRNSQKSFPDSQIPTAQQYIFNLIKPLSQIPAKAENPAKISILQMKIIILKKPDNTII